MEKKKLVGVSVAVIAILCAGLLIKPQKNNELPNLDISVQNGTKNLSKSNNKQNTDKKLINKAQKNKETETTVSQKEKIIKGNLLSELPNNAFTLSGITEFSKLPHNIQNNIKKIINDSNNIYLLKKQGEKVYLVTDNPANLRHGIEFIEISTNNGHQVKTTLGYNDKMKDSDNDKWEFVQISEEQLPLRHTKYNHEGDVDFIEVWNYDDNPVKYEMKTADGKVISLRKEIEDGSENLRIEHLVYDKDGHTKINVSTTFEGPDIKRFTYYNADKPAQSASVFCEYSDGLKVKETVYSSDLKVQNIYKSSYKDGERVDIKVFDENEKEIGEVLAE